MAKTLDFNSIKRPTLPVVMMDEERTQIRLSTPTEAMVEELQAILPELTRESDANAIALWYELAAKLFSCNFDGIVVTTQDLRGKYRMGSDHLIIFFSAYTDFINEISNAKN